MRKVAGLTLLAVLLTSFSLAQQIPLENWTVPPYVETGSPSGITPMTDITQPRVFVGIQPCRVVDTRPTQGFTGQWGPPIMAANAIRTFDINSAPHCPGIPASAAAYSLNFTVTQTAGPSGDIRVWPTGTPPILITSVLNWTVTNATLANATIMPAGSAGAIDIQVAGSNTHLLIDINGYFAHTLGNETHYLELRNSAPGAPAALFANSSNANMSTGVLGLTGPEFPRPGNYFAAGVRGEGTLTGVLGVSRLLGVAGSLVNVSGGETAFGLLGFKVDIGDPAIAGLDVGVFGQTNSAAAQAAGVIGYAPAGSGAIAGVRGLTGSESNAAAGVRGQDGGGGVAVIATGSAGVRGESHAWRGVLGLTHLGSGVIGAVVNQATGGSQTIGYLGYSSTVGLRVNGDSEVFGSKSFIEPHPTDPSKYIRYISLEGNEAGTYFRGKAKFQNGIAVIEVPEDFRIVTDPDGLSIQVTPIGQMASVAVASISLDRIVVRGSRNVEFFFTVNGVRRAYKQYGPVAENEKQFVPMSPDEPMLESIPAVLRERLITNGTYTADGKVNMETAKRLGWDKIWEQRSRPGPRPIEP